MEAARASRLTVGAPLAALALLAPGCAAAPGMAGRIEAPHAATGADGRVVAAWGVVADDGTADIALSHRGQIERINVVPRSAVAGRQVGPRVAPLPAGGVIVTWVDRARDPSGDILCRVRRPDGKLGPVVRANDDSGLRGQEYHDVAVLSDGRLILVWLDERDAAPGNDNDKQVYCAFSGDGGATWSPNAALTRSPQGVCPCCRPGVAALGDGGAAVIYRDRLDGRLLPRVVVIQPGAAGPGHATPVSQEPWTFPACPIDGPALVATAAGGLTAAWMDGSSGEQALWHARSADGGRSFGAAARLGAPAGSLPEAAPACCAQAAGGASPGRASLAHHPRRGTAAAWEDTAGSVWFCELDAVASPAQRVAGGGEVAAHSPQVVAEADGFRVLWVESALDAATGKMTAVLRQGVVEPAARGGG